MGADTKTRRWHTLRADARRGLSGRIKEKAAVVKEYVELKWSYTKPMIFSLFYAKRMSLGRTGVANSLFHIH